MKQNARDKAYEMLEEGLVTAEFLATACLQFMSCDDIEEMLNANDLVTYEFFDEDKEEE